MLTKNEIDRYHEDGYLMFPALIDGSRLANYIAMFDTIVSDARNRKPGGGWTYELDPDGDVRPEMMLHKVQGVCLVRPETLALAKEPAIVGRVASLIGPKLDMFGSKFFPMLPGGGTSTKWHQDNYYFDTQSDQVVTCGIYLQDTDRENGCLKIVPRSHTQGAFSHVRDVGTYGSWVDVDESKAIPLEVPGGTVILFSANLLHGANANVSSRTRYSTAWHYIPGDLHLAQFPKGVYEDRHTIVE